MAKQLMPAAELEPRANDVVLPDDWLLKLSLFAGLKQPPSIDKFPGSVVVRHYHPGEVIYRQGEGGGTAFYILTPQDRHVLRAGPKARLGSLPELIRVKFDRRAAAGREQLDAERRLSEQPQAAEAGAWIKQAEALKKERDKLDKELAGLEHERTTLPEVVVTLERDIAAGAANAPPQEVAVVHLAYAVTGSSTPSWWGRLKSAMRGQNSPVEARPIQISSDGPTNLDYQTRQASFSEGDWFGEMSCLHRTPRAGTVVATRECFMVELMRNIFEALRRDPEFSRRTDALYRERTLRSQLRALPV